MLKHTLRRYRLPIILFAVLITVLTWVLVAFAESKNYDANDDGHIDNNEIVEAARGYMRGEITQEEAVDYLLWAWSGLERWETPIPASTPTPRSTPTPYPTPTVTPSPVPTPTLRPIPTSTLRRCCLRLPP